MRSLAVGACVASSALVLLAGTATGQTAADSIGAMSAHLDYVFDADRAPHYFGGTPDDLHHPTGTVETFCLGWSERPGAYEAPLDDGSALMEVRERISETLQLPLGQGCRVTEHGETGLAAVEDREGRDAAQVGVGVSFAPEGAATVHLGVFTGGLGAWGFTCPLERALDGSWTVVASGCTYYES